MRQVVVEILLESLSIESWLIRFIDSFKEMKT